MAVTMITTPAKPRASFLEIFRSLRDMRRASEERAEGLGDFASPFPDRIEILVKDGKSGKCSAPSGDRP
jgi:hypothetical protein